VNKNPRAILRAKEDDVADLKERVAELEARNAELRGLLASMLPPHSGACCTFDNYKNVVVTAASCQCLDLTKRIRRALYGADWSD
jgi:hypothetical protein